MKEALQTMSLKEINRLEVLQKTEAKVIKRKEAARQMGVSVRQVIRLVKAYRSEGPTSLISKRRNKSGNRRHGDTFKQTIMGHVRNTYHDFGPTLAAEKILERHGLSINKETLRQWMIEADLWKGKPRKKRVIHQQRARRPCLGELVQIDGSPHDWFEGRSEKCCLLVFVDDATRRLMQLLFVETESTQSYFNATRAYLKQHGRPVAFYSDKHGVFRVNRSEAKSGTGETQYGRAMKELGINLIFANSPQAKGRVERANLTLQDRLIKELRIRKINDRESANSFLPEFIKDYNKRFAVDPADKTDAHRRSMPGDETLNLIFSVQSLRRLSKNLELSYNNSLYQISTPGQGYGLRQAKVTVCDDQNGQVVLVYKNRKLSYNLLDKKNQPARPSDTKQINHLVDRQVRKNASQYKPKADHPWRQYEKISKQKGKQEVRLENLSACSMPLNHIPTRPENASI